MFDRLFAATPGTDADQDLVRFCPAAKRIGFDLPTGFGNARPFLSEPSLEGMEKGLKQHGSSDCGGKRGRLDGIGRESSRIHGCKASWRRAC
ncbi:hypothetical protein [Candidatus Accumulibacter vicinus]|uniref:hypothetical protein n=1 Tax=Candidatus Accumulibacter vicinus TaxID=2954382 RepID=UPI00235B5BFF|nr:hypothetical protein [Candidatus Accumulibacter vicinus]